MTRFAEVRAAGALFARLGQSFLELAEAEERGDEGARRAAARDALRLLVASVEMAIAFGSPMDADLARRGVEGFAVEYGLAAPPPSPSGEALAPDQVAALSSSALFDAFGRPVDEAGGDAFLYDACGGVRVIVEESEHCSFCGRVLMPSETIERMTNPSRVWCSLCCGGVIDAQENR